jgi:hypothetical protein
MTFPNKNPSEREPEHVGLEIRELDICSAVEYAFHRSIPRRAVYHVTILEGGRSQARNV